MKKVFWILCIGLASVALLAISASARFVFAHMGLERSMYSAVDELSVNGCAEPYDRFLCLTPAAPFQLTSVWYGEKQEVGGGFGTIFQVQISEIANFFDDNIFEGLGGDGFAFVIQNESEDALGSNGGGIGYHGITESIAIEFDLWDNNLSGHDYLEDPNGNHVSVHTGGFGPNDEREAFSIGSTTNLPNLADGEVHTVIIEYEPGTLYVYVDDLEIPALVVELDIEQTIALEDGKAWVGFTASTGMAYQNQDIHNWAYTGREWDGGKIRLAVKNGDYPAVGLDADFRVACAEPQAESQFSSM